MSWKSNSAGIEDVDLSDVEAGGSVECYNQDPDDLFTAIYTFPGVDSDFSVGTASGDEDT